ncbi:MAG: hypothetical protein ACJ77E_21420 [Gaiellaceae bacterium]
MRRTMMLVVTGTIALALTAGASASQLIDRNATNVTLQVNAKGEAMLTYTAGGKVKHVLAWGAVNALPPTRGAKQVSFDLDYSGGYGKYRKQSYWTSFGGACAAYAGAPLAWKVVACKAPDQSDWALQAWQRSLPNYGLHATAAQSVWELRLSHWTGALPSLQIATGWSYRKYDQLFGAYTYDDVGVYGFSSTSAGNPLDSFGRNIYVDTFDSVYGKGWQRENSFLTHKTKGTFCYGLYPHGAHPAGNGLKYRATAEGPGVAPDVMWTGDAPGAYDAAADRESNDAVKAMGDAKCRPN